ncbi:MAG: hypothetical protein K2X28_03565 [Alphaproteobacteria bacterium]|nr:hypothetical protein [Alphaproteobacteria bacterium]
MKNFKLLSTSLIVALSFAASQASWGMEDDKFHDFSRLPERLQKHILEFDAYNRGAENKHFGSNKAVCKRWKNFYEANGSNNNIKNAWHEGRLVHLQKEYNITDPDNIETLKRVYNGKLIYIETFVIFGSRDHPEDIYYPNPETKKPTELLISELHHPLNGKFNLSKCGDKEKFVSFNMGYRKIKNPKNDSKIEIWIAPRFLIEREFNAVYFTPIMKDWDAEKAKVGIFFNWGGWDNFDRYDYIIDQAPEQLGNTNLQEKWLYDTIERGLTEEEELRDDGGLGGTGGVQLEHFTLCL